MLICLFIFVPKYSTHAHTTFFFFRGEQDGPTHQPVETVSGLRVFPNMDVMRPADPEETAAAYAAALDRKDGPTALILTRQNVRTLKEIPVSDGGLRFVSFNFLLISANASCLRVCVCDDDDDLLGQVGLARCHCSHGRLATGDGTAVSRVE